MTPEQRWNRSKTMREIRAEQRGEVYEPFEPVLLIYPKPIMPDRVVWDGIATIGSLRMDAEITDTYLSTFSQ